MSNYKLILIYLIGIFFNIGCVSESSDKLFPSNDAEARVVFDEQLSTILNAKCLSCHNFHSEGSSRYDSFDKTKSAISNIIKRINATDNAIMPPLGEAVLTTAEKQVFENFLSILNSEPDVNVEASKCAIFWTAYKYEDFDTRVGVSGTFDEVFYNLNNNAEKTIDLLANANIIINTASVNIDDKEGVRTTNVKSAFFAFLEPTITGKVIEYNEKEAVVALSLNGINKQMVFDVTEKDDHLLLKGKIEDLGFFKWDQAFDELNKVCGEFHENKLWPDIDINVRISRKE